MLELTRTHAAGHAERRTRPSATKARLGSCTFETLEVDDGYDRNLCKALTPERAIPVPQPAGCRSPGLSPDRYALLRVLQPLDAAQVMRQAVRRVASHDGDHDLWLQQRGLGLELLLHQRRQLNRRAAAHRRGQQRAQRGDSHGPDRAHLRFQVAREEGGGGGWGIRRSVARPGTWSRGKG